MALKLVRSGIDPILTPDPASPWENINVFNPSVIHHNGLFHMHYRAEGTDWISRIGYAVSSDGVHWNRIREPVLIPVDRRDGRGVQDPRVAEIDGTFYMTYTAWAPYEQGERCGGGNIFPMIARSDNLIAWERIGAIEEYRDNKDHVLFPKKIDGRFAALVRRRKPSPVISLAFSDDLINWDEKDMKPIMGPRKDGWWDFPSIGGNGVPIESDEGWLLFYHGTDKENAYRIGVALVDLDDPSKVINRPKDPILEPEEVWEVRGDVPNVVFSNANIRVGDTLFVYYGGGDHVVGLATSPFDRIVEYARHG